MSEFHPEMPEPSENCNQIVDINREFLRLLTHPAIPVARPMFGLNPDLLDSLRRLSRMELEQVASIPLLLAEFTSIPGLGSSIQPGSDEVAETPPLTVWQSEARSFADRLLTCLWQAARQGHLQLPFGIGVHRSVSMRYAELSFGHIGSYSEVASTLLRARLAAHADWWPDIIRSVRSADTARLTTVQLSAIPLTVAQQYVFPFSLSHTRYS